MFTNSVHQQLIKPRKTLLKRSLWDTIIRVFLSAVGSYATAAISTAVFSIILPIKTSDAVLFAIMLSFISFTVCIIVSFKIQKLLSLFLFFIGINACLGIILFIFGSIN